jgi:hypothetical protein
MAQTMYTHVSKCKSNKIKGQIKQRRYMKYIYIYINRLREGRQHGNEPCWFHLDGDSNLTTLSKEPE